MASSDGRYSEGDLQNIVRVVSNLGDLSPADSSTSRTSRSTTEELNQRFQIPRRRQQEPSCTGREAATNTNALATGFSDRHNYGSATRQPRRQRRQAQRSTYTGRFQPYRGPEPKRDHRNSREETGVYLKDVCLLPDPKYTRVPRGKIKADFINDGLFIDAWKVARDWDEATLRKEVGKLFSSILKDSNGEDIGFDFVRSVGINILPIKLQDGQDLNARVLRHICGGTSPIYIRALQSIDGQEGPEDSGEEHQQPNSDIRQFVQNQQSSTATQPSRASQRDQLGSMFPNKELGAIERALAHSNNNMAEAIEMLLPNSSDVKDHGIHESDSELMHSAFGSVDQHRLPLQSGTGHPFEDVLENTPLAAAPIVGLSAKQSLQKFIEGAVKPFDLDMHVQVDRGQDMLTQMIRKYKNPVFDLTRPLNVEFVGADEEGIDAGGVTREYFYFLMESLKGGSPNGMILFEGQPGHLVPKHDYDILSSGMFTIAGKMILHAVLNKCLGVSGVSPPIISYLVTSKRDSAIQHITLEDIPDPCLQEQLKQLLSCDEEDLPKFMNSDCLGDLLLASGFPHLEITAKTRSMAYECCLLNEVITKRIPALEDMTRGLASVRVMGITLLDLMAQHVQLAEHVFPCDEDGTDIAMLKLAVKYDYEGKDEEMQARDFFDKYVEEIASRDQDSAEEKLKDLLLFWTGYHRLSDTTQNMLVGYLPLHPNNVMAEADTCALTLRIPTVHRLYEDFRHFMDSSLTYGKVGFGRF